MAWHDMAATAAQHHLPQACPALPPPLPCPARPAAGPWQLRPLLKPNANQHPNPKPQTPNPARPLPRPPAPQLVQDSHGPHLSPADLFMDYGAMDEANTRHRFEVAPALVGE